MTGQAGGRTTDFALLAALALIWGSTNLMIKVAVTSIPPMTVGAARIAIALLAFGLLALGRLHAVKAALVDWRNMAQVAVTSYILPPFLIAYGTVRIDSSVAAITVGSVPIFTAALSYMLTGRERPDARGVAGVAIGFLGIVALIAPRAGSFDADMIGFLAVLGGAFSYALTNVLLPRASQHDHVAAGAIVLVFAVVVLGPLSLIVDAPWTLEPTALSLLALVGLGVIVTGMGLVVYFRLMARTGPVFVATVNYLTPLVGAALGVAVLGENLGWNGLLALALILTGVGLATLKRRKAAATATPQPRPSTSAME